MSALPPNVFAFGSTIIQSDLIRRSRRSLTTQELSERTRHSKRASSSFYATVDPVLSIDADEVEIINTWQVQPDLTKENADLLKLLYRTYQEKELTITLDLTHLTSTGLQINPIVSKTLLYLLNQRAGVIDAINIRPSSIDELKALSDNIISRKKLSTQINIDLTDVFESILESALKTDRQTHQLVMIFKQLLNTFDSLCLEPVDFNTIGPWIEILETQKLLLSAKQRAKIQLYETVDNKPWLESLQTLSDAHDSDHLSIFTDWLAYQDKAGFLDMRDPSARMALVDSPSNDLVSYQVSYADYFGYKIGPQQHAGSGLYVGVHPVSSDTFNPYAGELLPLDSIKDPAYLFEIPGFDRGIDARLTGNFASRANEVSFAEDYIEHELLFNDCLLLLNDATQLTEQPQLVLLREAGVTPTQQAKLHTLSKRQLITLSKFLLDKIKTYDTPYEYVPLFLRTQHYRKAESNAYFGRIDTSLAVNVIPKHILYPGAAVLLDYGTHYQRHYEAQNINRNTHGFASDRALFEAEGGRLRGRHYQSILRPISMIDKLELTHQPSATHVMVPNYFIKHNRRGHPLHSWHKALYHPALKDLPIYLADSTGTLLPDDQQPGINAIMYACTLDSPDLALQLIKDGANPWFLNRRFDCALSVALRNPKWRDEQSLEFLHALKAQIRADGLEDYLVDWQNGDNSNFLMLAIYNKRYLTLTELVKHQPETTYEQVETPVDSSELGMDATLLAFMQADKQALTILFQSAPEAFFTAFEGNVEIGRLNTAISKLTASPRKLISTTKNFLSWVRLQQENLTEADYERLTNISQQLLKIAKLNGYKVADKRSRVAAELTIAPDIEQSRVRTRSNKRSKLSVKAGAADPLLKHYLFAKRDTTPSSFSDIDVPKVIKRPGR